MIAKKTKPPGLKKKAKRERSESSIDSVDRNTDEIEDEFFGKNYEDEQIKAIRRKYPIPRNTWIVKPGENSNRGVGIDVASELSEIRYLVGTAASRSGSALGNSSEPTTVIIQKYIDNPFLIHRRKFDFRIFAMVSCIN